MLLSSGLQRYTAPSYCEPEKTGRAWSAAKDLTRGRREANVHLIPIRQRSLEATRLAYYHIQYASLRLHWKNLIGFFLGQADNLLI